MGQGHTNAELIDWVIEEMVKQNEQVDARVSRAADVGKTRWTAFGEWFKVKWINLCDRIKVIDATLIQHTGEFKALREDFVSHRDLRDEVNRITVDKWADMIKRESGRAVRRQLEEMGVNQNTILLEDFEGIFGDNSTPAPAKAPVVTKAKARKVYRQRVPKRGDAQLMAWFRGLRSPKNPNFPFCVAYRGKGSKPGNYAVYTSAPEGWHTSHSILKMLGVDVTKTDSPVLGQAVRALGKTISGACPYPNTMAYTLSDDPRKVPGILLMAEELKTTGSVSKPPHTSYHLVCAPENIVVDAARKVVLKMASGRYSKRQLLRRDGKIANKLLRALNDQFPIR